MDIAKMGRLYRCGGQRPASRGKRPPCDGLQAKKSRGLMGPEHGRRRHCTADICPDMLVHGAQARSNVGKRLEFIRRELERLASQADSLSEKHTRKQQQARPPRRCYPHFAPPPPPPSQPCP